MVSPHRLSVTKDWPEYKNRISFVKRRTQTWFKRQKNNPSMFKESLGGRGREESSDFDQEFKTNRGAEACGSIACGVTGVLFPYRKQGVCH